ncbi:MAG TPA: AAA family ATPase, partial [Candidatus Tumulicola sp.]|nr:AAA family ATPase [Candidatus Tumulicola sp.]
VDWAVHMERLSDDDRADHLLGAGAVDEAFVDRIAARIAEFHRTAATSYEIRRYGDAAVVARNVAENFEQVGDGLERSLSAAEAREVIDYQVAFLREHRARFDARIAADRIRDGHGDLRLEHVYRRGGEGIVVLDCIEFNDRFRYADVCADIAFLGMDFAANGRADLAERLLATYARESQDYDLYGVVDFYESYRAFVRGKIASMLARDPGLNDTARTYAETQARRFFRLALSFHRFSLLGPMLVTVGGVIASGKSSLADRLGAMLSAPVIDADRTRKTMAGIGLVERNEDPAFQGAYDPAFSERVYSELFRRASVVLASGRPVVLDASFRTASLREAARQVAATHGVPFRFVECRAPREICLARLASREQGPSVSDGRRAIFDDFVAHYEPVSEMRPAQHAVVDTTKPLDENLGWLRDLLLAWPRGLPG